MSVKMPSRLPHYILAFVFLFCVMSDLLIARAIVPNADMAQNYNEMLAIRQGNVLLQHWLLGIDNYIFTDLTFFLIFGAIFGVKLWLLYVIPPFVFALLLLAAIMLVIRAAPSGSRRWPGALAVILLIGVPFAPAQYVFLVSVFHTSSIMFCLYALLCVQPVLAMKRLDRRLLIPFCFLIFAMAASDPVTDIVFTAPLLILMFLRACIYPGLRPDHIMILVATLVSAGAGTLWPSIIGHNHGFHTTMDVETSTALDLPTLEFHVKAIFAGLRLLSNAYAPALPGIAGAGIFATIRFIFCGVLLLMCVPAIWRTMRSPDQGVTHLLILGALSLAGADLVSSYFMLFSFDLPAYFPGRAIRFVTPIFIFLGLTGIIEGQTFLAKVKPGLNHKAIELAGIIVIAGFIAGVGQAVWKAAREPAGLVMAPQYALANWLRTQHLAYGISDYWTANMVTVLTNADVVADGVLNIGGFRPNFQNTDTTRLLANVPPDFLVVSPNNGYGLSQAIFVRRYGIPREICHVGHYVVLVMSKFASEVPSTCSQTSVQ